MAPGSVQSPVLPGPPVGPPPAGRSRGGQERAVGTVGNEATIWYFRLEQLQLKGKLRASEGEAGQRQHGTPRASLPVKGGDRAPSGLEWPLGSSGLAPRNPLTVMGKSGLD